MTDTIIEIIGACIGLVYLYCELKAHIALWYVGLLMAVFYIYIFASSHLYANAGISAYNFVAGIYGLVVWRRMRKRGEEHIEEDVITRCPRKMIAPLAVVALLLTVALSLLLTKTAESPAPILDGASAALGIVGLWLIAHKHIEHWYLWMVVNLVTVVMCLVSGLYPTAGMYAVYFVGSFIGFFSWRKKMVEAGGEERS